jgi:hypothetical protein
MHGDNWQGESDASQKHAADDRLSGPVQLEHMIGLGAKYPNSALMLTHSDRYHVKRYIDASLMQCSMYSLIEFVAALIVW